jgi:transcriptional regulator GlxA family with amidase domain
VLQRIFGHESDPVPFAAAIEHGALGIAACRPATASVAEIARTHQFLEPGRFAVIYRTIFGEMPSSTLRRNPTELA